MHHASRHDALCVLRGGWLQQVVVGKRFRRGQSAVLDAAIDRRHEALILFPSQSSVGIQHVVNDDRVEQMTHRAATMTVGDGPVATGSEDAKSPEAAGPAYTLILIDGTWNEARSMLNQSEYLCRESLAPPATDASTSTSEVALSRIPGPVTHVRRVHLDSVRCGEYQWRKEPRDFTLSTLEAVVYAIQDVCGPQVRLGRRSPGGFVRHAWLTQPVCQANGACDALLRAFRAMVHIQAKFSQAAKLARERRVEVASSTPHGVADGTATGALEDATEDAGARRTPRSGESDATAAIGGRSTCTLGAGVGVGVGASAGISAASGVDYVFSPGRSQTCFADGGEGDSVPTRPGELT